MLNDYLLRSKKRVVAFKSMDERESGPLDAPGNRESGV